MVYGFPSGQKKIRASGTKTQIIGPEQQDLDGVLPVLFWLFCMDLTGRYALCADRLNLTLDGERHATDASRSESQWRCWRIISKVVFWTAVVSFLSVMDNPAAAISTRMQETMTARKSLSMTANAGRVRSFLEHVSGERFALCLTKKGGPDPGGSLVGPEPLDRRPEVARAGMS